MSPAEVARLRALADKARPGPWRFGPGGPTVLAPAGEAGAFYVVADLGEDDGAFRGENGDLIAAFREGVPALCDALDAERERADRLERELAEARSAAAVTWQGVCRAAGSDRPMLAIADQRAALVALVKASGEVLGGWDLAGELAGPVDALRAARSRAIDLLPLPPCTCGADPEGPCLGCAEASAQGRDPAEEAEAAAYASGEGGGAP